MKKALILETALSMYEVEADALNSTEAIKNGKKTNWMTVNRRGAVPDRDTEPEIFMLATEIQAKLTIEDVIKIFKMAFAEVHCLCSMTETGQEAYENGLALYKSLGRLVNKSIFQMFFDQAQKEGKNEEESHAFANEKFAAFLSDEMFKRVTVSG